MKLKKAQLIAGCALLVLVLLFVDQITKLLATYYLMAAESGPHTFTLIPGFIGFMYTENDAIAFGIGSGNRVFMICVMVLTAALIVAIVALVFTVFKKNRPAQIALCFIEAGAIGNFIDRLTVVNANGEPVVRDFINMLDFKPLAWAGSEFNFGVCNIADYFIVFGAIALLVIILFIGPAAIFPGTKKWRAEAKALEEEKVNKLPPAPRPSEMPEGSFEEIVVFDNTRSEEEHAEEKTGSMEDTEEDTRGGEGDAEGHE